MKIRWTVQDWKTWRGSKKTEIKKLKDVPPPIVASHNRTIHCLAPALTYLVVYLLTALHLAMKKFWPYEPNSKRLLVLIIYSSFLIWFIACPAALPMYCRSVAEIYAFLFCHDYYLLLSRIKHFRFLWWSCTCQCSQFGFKYAGKSTHYSLLLLNKRLLICLIFYSMSWTKKCTREMRQACSEFPHFRELSSVLMT